VEPLPIQVGIAGQPFAASLDPLTAAAPFDATHVAILRGRVTDASGAPLETVTVRIKDHPAFGHTVTRADGHFDMAVEGGGPLFVEYEKTG
jgi:hypothetical protein